MLAVDRLDEAGRDHGVDAVARARGHRVVIGGGAGPVVKLGAADVERGVREGDGVAVVVVDVPANVVGVEVRDDHNVDVRGRDAELLEALRQLAAAGHAERAARHAEARVDQGVVAVAADQERAEVERDRVFRVGDADRARPLRGVDAAEEAAQRAVGCAVAERGDLQAADRERLAEP
ncbi:MAG: hypothetical protein O2895_03355 [Chloroflexi bacterium]|nr:hypothetical protein [Chloroflexota bacterium]